MANQTVLDECCAGGLAVSQMKKVKEFCKKCKTEQPHRLKRKVYKDKKQYHSYNKPLVCMTCGYCDKPIAKTTKNKKKHISMAS